MSYTTTRLCNQDIAGIYVQGAKLFGVAQAERYQVGLRSTFEIIAANPRLARLRTEYRRPVRLHPYGSHMIVYVETAAGIEVVRVLHGRQDWQRHLG